MSPENDFMRKLERTYGNNGSSRVTPAQIERHIGSSGKLLGNLQEVSELTGIIDIGLLKEVFHPNGKLLVHKIPTCVQSLEHIREELGEDAEKTLMYLDPKCFKQNGKINLRRLRKNVKKANGK